ncbi:MAG: GNAT family N-acetyltransferase [Myxococcota bacterium]
MTPASTVERIRGSEDAKSHGQSLSKPRGSGSHQSVDFAFRPAASETDLDGWADLMVDAFAAPAERGREYVRLYPPGDGWIAVTGDPDSPGGERVVGGLGLCAAAQRWGGRDVPMDGVAAVCTAPDVRGQGISSRLVAAGLQASRARGRPLSALYPASLALYRKAGYEVAGAVYRMRLRLDALPRVEGDDGIMIRPTTRAELEAAALDKRPAQGNLSERGTFFWNRTFRPRDEPRALGLFAGQRMVGGLVVSRTPVDHGRHDLELKRWWAEDDRALRALLGLLRHQGSLGRYASWYGAPTDRLVMALPAEIWEVERVQPWMLRVVDLASAFALRGFAAGLTSELDLGVDDPVCPWNTGRWHIAVSAGRAQVTRRAERPDGAAVAVDALGLARLYAGVVPFQSGLCAGPAAWLDEGF